MFCCFCYRRAVLLALSRYSLFRNASPDLCCDRVIFLYPFTPKLGVVVQKGVSLAGTMETPGGGFDESGEPNPAVVRWVAPVDPVTGVVDSRLCFVYADLWRRVLSPEAGELEPLQSWEAARAEATVPKAGTGGNVNLSSVRRAWLQRWLCLAAGGARTRGGRGS